MSEKPFFCNTSKASSIPALNVPVEVNMNQTQSKMMMTNYNKSIQESKFKEPGLGSDLGGAFPSIEDINGALNTQSKFYEPYNKVQIFDQARGSGKMQ